MSTYITGFCSVGACEGTAKKSPSGQYLRTCRGTYSVPVSHSFGKQIKVVCTHSCHTAFNEIREMMAAMGKIDIPAVPVAPKETPTPTGGPVPTQRPAPAATQPATGLLPFQRATVEGMVRTETGRAAKGQLEEQVRLALVKNQIFVEAGMVTPGYLARVIDKDKPPSQGAIGAVMDRWEKKGLINIGRKPLRISKVTSLGERILLKKGQ